MQDQPEREPEPRERRILTPAVLASALFVAACATFAISFVAARGGLDLAANATTPPVAVASTEPTPLTTPEPLPSAEPSVAPSSTPIATPVPSVAPSSGTLIAVPPLKAGDPLRKLDPCPGHPACVIYIVQRNDTFGRILGRYNLNQAVILALNPKLDDPSLIVVGQKLYLGRDRFARLDPCPNGERCFLYTVVKGDSVKEIASRYGITQTAIRDANPTMPTPIVPKLVLKLPYPG
jgi:LysM domain